MATSQVTAFDAVRQTLVAPSSSSATAELVFEVILADSVASSVALDLQVSNESIQLQTPGSAMPIIVATAQSIDSENATAKFTRRQRRLLVRGPIKARPRWIAGGTCVRAQVGGIGRGMIVIRLPLPAAGSEEAAELADATCYVLVSRTGSRPSPAPGDFGWCHVFPMAASTIVTVRIDTVAWLWDAAEAVVAFGVLSDAEAPPFIEPGCEQVGVTFLLDAVGSEGTASPAAATAAAAAAGNTAAADTDAAAAAAAATSTAAGGAGSATASGSFATEFVPEEARLATDELRRACRLYKRAFATGARGDAVDGFARSLSYVRRRPPPPAWSDAIGAPVVDHNHVSLTYGEAEFEPFFRMMRAIGVRRDDVIVDIGSGTGRMVLGAALAFPDAREVRGIELVPDLHEGAVQAHAWLVAELGGTAADHAAIDAADAAAGSAVAGGAAVGGAAAAAVTEASPLGSPSLPAPPPSSLPSPPPSSLPSPSPPSPASPKAPLATQTHARERHRGMAPVLLVEGDILLEDWADADIVLATSLCFPTPLLAKVYRKALGLHPGAKFVCMQEDLTGDPEAEVLDAIRGLEVAQDGASEADSRAASQDVLGAANANETSQDDAQARWCRDAAGRRGGFRCVKVQEEVPQHLLTTQMSWGEARFYVYERV